MRDDSPPDHRPKDAREVQELWFALARKPWTTIVLAPVSAQGSAEDIARALADVGKHVSDTPVTAISMRRLGPGSARALATLSQHMRRERDAQTSLYTGPMPPGATVDPTEVDAEVADPSMPDLRPLVPTAGQLIVAIPSLLAEPLGLAITQSADSVVLSVEIGRTLMSETEKSIELIGRDRLAGCFLIR